MVSYVIKQTKEVGKLVNSQNLTIILIHTFKTRHIQHKRCVIHSFINCTKLTSIKHSLNKINSLINNKTTLKVLERTGKLNNRERIARNLRAQEGEN